MSNKNNSKNLAIIGISILVILIAMLVVIVVWSNREEESPEIKTEEIQEPDMGNFEIDPENIPESPSKLPVPPVPIMETPEPSENQNQDE